LEIEQSQNREPAEYLECADTLETEGGRAPMCHALGEGRGAKNRREPDEKLSPRKLGVRVSDRAHSGCILEHTH